MADVSPAKIDNDSRAVAQMHSSLKRWLGVSGTLAVAYTAVVVALTDAATLWSWLHTLVATFISVALAVATGLLIYQRQKADQSQQDKADELEVLRAVLAEYLEVLKMLLPDEFARWHFKGAVHIDYFDPTLFESVARTGRHAPELTLLITQTARAIRQYNLHVQHFLETAASTAAGGGTGTHLLKEIADNVEYAYGNIKHVCQTLLSAVEATQKDPNFRPTVIHFRHAFRSRQAQSGAPSNSA
jgi:hypothetical protein